MWLVEGASAGDSLFFHYSGHGGIIYLSMCVRRINNVFFCLFLYFLGRVEDDDEGEEKDGYDETVVPIDYKKSGQIRGMYKLVYIYMCKSL